MRKNTNYRTKSQQFAINHSDYPPPKVEISSKIAVGEEYSLQKMRLKKASLLYRTREYTMDLHKYVIPDAVVYAHVIPSLKIYYARSAHAARTGIQDTLP